MEHFYTIQGEGFHQGRPAYFIRLAGCDVGCPWCDVKESWTVSESQILPFAELLASMKNFPTGICVITGGEPAMYDLSPLTTALREVGWKTHIETSGAYPFSGMFDWICVSPKKFKPVLPEWLAIAQEIKVIVYNKSDLPWAEKHMDLSNPDCQLYLQPEWDREKLVLPLIVDYIKSNPRWRISLQIHKYLGID
jgi:organic radical activating enzyme